METGYGGEKPEVLASIDRLAAKIGDRLEKRLQAAGFDAPPKEVFLRVLKHEGLLEVWAGVPGQKLKLLAAYTAYNLPLSNLSENGPDEAGPKLRVFDLKVPEGVYPLLYHNPWSSYHLSIAVGYPNLSDAIRGKLEGRIEEAGLQQLSRWWKARGSILQKNMLSGPEGLWDGAAVKPLGNQIFIHGKQVTIGCVPIGDEAIEELFVLTDPRVVGGTEVHIFPGRMDDPSIKQRLEAIGKESPALHAFWASLGPVYDAFEASHQTPAVEIDPVTGLYRLKTK